MGKTDPGPGAFDAQGTGEVRMMHKHNYTGAAVLRMKRQLRAERSERLWLYKLLSVAVVTCAVLTGTLLAVAVAAGML